MTKKTETPKALAFGYQDIQLAVEGLKEYGLTEAEQKGLCTLIAVDLEEQEDWAERVGSTVRDVLQDMGRQILSYYEDGKHSELADFSVRGT